MSPSSASDAQSPTSPSSTTQSPQRSPKPEIRRLTSNTALVTAPHQRGLSPRSSQHLGSARGTLSPAASIPSSPTSIQSSSSAIFERDVEPLLPPSSSPGHHAPTNPHLVPRGKGTEALDASVPSVLDSAVEVLGAVDTLADVSVVAPAPSALALSLASALSPTSPSRSSRGTSPIRSRSPSPLRAHSTAPSGLEHSLLGLSASPSPVIPAASPPRPTIDTQAAAAAPAPKAAPAESTSSSPTTTTAERAPALPTPTPTPAAAFNIQARSTGVAIPRTSPPLSPSASERLGAPPSPGGRASKRLSFLSYADLLSSTPASSVPLAALTSSAGTEPPPHLPSVLGLAALHDRAGSGASSLHGVPLGGASPSGHGHGFGSTGHAARGTRESTLLVPGEEAGGEWEREGLGMGLEERVEVLLSSSPASAVAGKA